MSDIASAHDLFVFGVPLVPKVKARNWQKVLINLRSTLISVINQTDRNFLCLVASNDLAVLPGFSSEHVIFFKLRQHEEQNQRVGNDYKAGNNDANRKKCLLAQQARNLGASYFMPLDADDLISNRLVEVVRALDPHVGCALKTGFVMDAETRKILECPSKYIPVGSFDRYCGSSLVYRLGKAPDFDWPTRVLSIGHHRVRDFLAMENNPMLDLELPLVIYTLNNGENISTLPSNSPNHLEFYQHVSTQLKVHGKPAGKREISEFSLSS